MYEIGKELKEKINQLNMELSAKYSNLLKMNKNDIGIFIEENIGQIVQLEKMSTDELEFYYDRGGIIGVDGSRNRLGGAYPHYVEVYQGLAKSSISNNNPIYLADTYTPLSIKGDGEIIKRYSEDSEIGRAHV